MSKTIQRLKSAAVRDRLLERPQPLGVLPTFAFWSAHELGWAALVLGVVVAAVVLFVDVPLIVGAMIPIVAFLVLLGGLERWLRVSIARDTRATAEP